MDNNVLIKYEQYFNYIMNCLQADQVQDAVNELRLIVEGLEVKYNIGCVVECDPIEKGGDNNEDCGNKE